MEQKPTAATAPMELRRRNKPTVFVREVCQFPKGEAGRGRARCSADARTLDRGGQGRFTSTARRFFIEGEMTESNPSGEDAVPPAHDCTGYRLGHPRARARRLYSAPARGGQGVRSAPAQCALRPFLIPKSPDPVARGAKCRCPTSGRPKKSKSCSADRSAEGQARRHHRTGARGPAGSRSRRQLHRREPPTASSRRTVESAGNPARRRLRRLQ